MSDSCISRLNLIEICRILTYTRAIMRKNMDVLPLRQMLSVSHSATSPKSKKRAKPRSHLLSEGIVCFLSLTALSAAASDLRGHPTPQVSLLSEFRPIGGAGNNLHFYWLNA